LRLDNISGVGRFRDVVEDIESFGLGFVGIAPVAGVHIGYDFRTGEVKTHSHWRYWRGLSHGWGGDCEVVERVPRFGWAAGQGVADLFAGETAVFVAEHEHVEAWGGRVVHEVIVWVRLVSWCAHEEGRGCA